MAEKMMNLHINLILESERRSSSRISRKFLAGVSAFTAVLLFLSLIAVVMLGAQSAKKNLRFAEQELKQLEPVFRTVTDLKHELAAIRDATNAIAAWSGTRPDWPGLLLGLQSAVPENIQLTRLTVNENISIIENTPTRSVTLYLQGKASGEHADTEVQTLEKNLKEKPPFTAVMETAKVKQFEAVRNTGQENMRVFDIDCRFKTSRLFQPVKDTPKDSK